MTLEVTIRPTDVTADCDGTLVRVWTGYTHDGGRVKVLVAAVKPMDARAEVNCRELLTEIPSPQEGGQPGARERWLESLGLSADASPQDIDRALRLRKASGEFDMPAWERDNPNASGGD